MPVVGPQLGRNMVLQVNIAGEWNTFLGMQSTSVDVANVIVPSTSIKSGGWREILPDCGNQTCSFSGTGVFKNSFAEQWCIYEAVNHTLIPARVVFEDNSMYTGVFLVSKISYTGTHNGARMFNVTLESSGTVYTPPVTYP